MKLEIVPATIEHAKAIDLRPGDRREVEALGHQSAAAGVARALERSLWADAYLIDGKVAAILGLVVISVLCDSASLWVLTGSPVDLHKKLFLRETRRRLAEVRRDWPRLAEYVHAEYVEAIRWLHWLGYTIAPPEPYGPKGALFCRASIGE